jgi:hypothetical protein
MALNVGSTQIGSVYLGSTRIAAAYYGSTKVYQYTPPNYNPLNLPAYTLRGQLRDGTFIFGWPGTKTQVSETPNVWDFYYNNASWEAAFMGQSNLIAVLGANLAGVTNMYSLFQYCSGLSTVALFDTRNVTNFRAMFEGCRSLQRIPLFPTDSCTNCRSCFNDCSNVEGGALALYNQLSSQSGITDYANTFTNCGSNTVTGLAELNQIPTSWGGLMS